MAQTILSLKKGSDRTAFVRDAKQAGYTLKPVKGLPRHFIIEGVAPPQFGLGNHPAVEACEDGDAPVYPAEQAITLDVTLADGSWALPRIIRRQAPWNVDRIKLPMDTYFRSERDGTGVDYYIMDTGIATAHSEFGGRATDVYEFASSGGAGDDHGHGTSTASLAVGATVGVARGADIFSFKISTSSAGLSSDAALTTAIGQLLTHYGARSNPAVCSISYTFSSGTVLSAIADMIDDGIVVVGAAGNGLADLSGINVYPAEATDAISCGGIGMADIPYYLTNEGTNFGTGVDIVAPAQSIRAAAAPVRGVGDYHVFWGTSAAAPLVGGVVACMLEGHSRLTGRTQVQAVKTALLSNATTGKLRTAFGLTPLPDKILYLDPNQVAPETIAGL
ncbi:S8 family serine peptidase [Mesorhizobium sp.]|uniref:S8 family serine peptidase n=1 Tax=Mesorhizobium sp. TaxID=1871066 RepID=UPI000FE5622D|nr:S8 family serine peptidase [Mesorhizobium sp.]RWN58770.1 MAG: hypothetical protein EOS00_20495 [Mesorhizobium sp.]